jgi:hypothetical protein
MHVTDWLPTLVAGAAGIELGSMDRPCSTCNRSVAPWDGVDQWTAMLSEGPTSARTEVLLDLHAIDCSRATRAKVPCNIPGSGAIRIGKWKLLHGHQGNYYASGGGTQANCVARAGVPAAALATPFHSPSPRTNLGRGAHTAGHLQRVPTASTSCHSPLLTSTALPCHAICHETPATSPGRPCSST